MTRERSIKKIAISVVFIIFILFTFCYALETNTHEDINEYVARNNLNEFSLNTYLEDRLGIQDGIEKSFNSRQVWGWLRIGGLKEDLPYWYMPWLRSANHFHNPLTDKGFSGIWGTGFISGTSALQWSQKPIGTQSPGGYYSWHDVRNYFYKALTASSKTERENNYAETFRGIGQLMHLVQDMSVPEHTRDDGHYLPAYEAWIEGTDEDKNKNVYISPKDGIILIKETQFSPESLFIYPITSLGNTNPIANVPIANLFDTNQYDGTNPIISLQDNIGLSEYSNANFLSPDTIFTNFPYPSWSSVEEYDEVMDKSSGKVRTYLRKVSDGEVINHLAACKWFYKYLPSSHKNSGLKLDETVYSDYSQKLIPRAIGYSAGLLNYFFRGDIEEVDPEVTRGDNGNMISVKLKVKNRTPNEAMIGSAENPGKLVISYRYKNLESEVYGVSEEIMMNEIINYGQESSEVTFEFNPSIPANAQEAQYWLVYRGKLGNEEGAVIGKKITLEAIDTFFLVNYADQIVFRYDIDGNEYKIEPIEKKIPLEGDKSGYRTWTVVTNPENNRHFVTWPQSYNYLDCIEHYGLETGTNYLWRPGDFGEGSEYILTTTCSYNEPDYTVSALGRHNYTIDDNDKMVSYDESIWAKGTNGCSNLDYVYRYKNEHSGDNFIDGRVITSNQLGEDSVICTPGQGCVRCSGPKVDNNIIAAAGDNKAIYIEHEYQPNEGSSTITERELEEGYTVNFVWCVGLYPPDYKLHYIHSTMTGTFWVNYMKSQNARKEHIALNIAGEELEVVEFSPHISETEGYLNAGGGWDRSNSSWEDLGEAPPDCPDQVGSCTVNPATVTFTGLIEQVRSEGAAILVHDFDNVQEDNSFIVIYSVTSSESNSGATTIQMECKLDCGSLSHRDPSPDLAPLGKCNEIGRTTGDPFSGKTRKYYVAYRIPSDAETKKEILYVESVTGEDVFNKVLTGFSTQASKETMVYTYVMKELNGSEYDFDRRIVGIINVSSDKLDKGYRQEFVIDEENFSIEDFDYTQMAGIGIHKF